MSDVHKLLPILKTAQRTGKLLIKFFVVFIYFLLTEGESLTKFSDVHKICLYAQPTFLYVHMLGKYLDTSACESHSVTCSWFSNS